MLLMSEILICMVFNFNWLFSYGMIDNLIESICPF